MVSLRKTLCCLLLVAGAATSFVACGGDESDGGGDQATDSSSNAAAGSDSAATGSSAGETTAPADAGLDLKFNPAFSYFIEGADAPQFRVPFWVEGQDITGAEWTVEPEGAVTWEDSNDFGAGGRIATMRQTGEIKITVDTGEKQAVALLTVDGATMEEWMIGSDRYNNEVMFTMPDLSQFMDADSGTVMITDEERMMLRTAAMEELSKPLSCNNCHSPESTLGKAHGPGQVAGWTNDDLIKIMAMGMKPPGAPFLAPPIQFIFSMLHTWEGDEATLRGLTVYVRSLDPVMQDTQMLLADLAMRFGNFGGGSFGGAPAATPTPMPAP